LSPVAVEPLPTATLSLPVALAAGVVGSGVRAVPAGAETDDDAGNASAISAICVRCGAALPSMGSSAVKANGNTFQGCFCSTRMTVIGNPAKMVALFCAQYLTIPDQRQMTRGNILHETLGA
jgi:hypothetical protein